MWFKMDDKFHSSKKLMKIPKRARFGAAGLWSIAGSWCGEQLTDGFVPKYMLDAWGPPPSASSALVDVGLWAHAEGGFQFVNWSEYQPTKADVERDRARNRERQQAWRERHQKNESDANLEDSNEIRERFERDSRLESTLNLLQKPRKYAEKRSP